MNLREFQFLDIVEKYIDYRGRTPLKLGMHWSKAGNIPALSANNVQMGKIDFSKECNTGTEELYNRWMQNGECAKGDILLTMEAPLGNVAQVPDENKYILSQRVLLIRPNAALVSKDFLAQLMRSPSFQLELLRNSSGSTARGIQRKRLDKIKLALPSLPEQDKIARILFQYDRISEKNEELILRKNLQFKYLVNYTIHKSGYPRAHLSDFIREVSIRNRKGKIERVLSVTNHSGFVLPEDQFERRVASEDLSNYKIVQRGQYAYNPSRINVGSIARLDEWDDGVLSPMYIVFQLDESKINSDYFLHWLSSSEARQRIKKSAQGSVREIVGFGDLCSLPMPFPPLERQKEIADVLNLALKEIKLLESLTKKYQMQKRGLMQKLLTGEWQVAA